MGTEANETSTLFSNFSLLLLVCEGPCMTLTTYLHIHHIFTCDSVELFEPELDPHYVDSTRVASVLLAHGFACNNFASE